MSVLLIGNWREMPCIPGDAEIRLSIYLKNNPAKFCPNPVSNSAALGFFLKRSPQQQEQQ